MTLKIGQCGTKTSLSCRGRGTPAAGSALWRQEGLSATGLVSKGAMWLRWQYSSTALWQSHYSLILVRPP
jgi:hypothetical protein